jgi:hypothetical protein
LSEPRHRPNPTRRLMRHDPISINQHIQALIVGHVINGNVGGWVDVSQGEKICLAHVFNISKE